MPMENFGFDIYDLVCIPDLHFVQLLLQLLEPLLESLVDRSYPYVLVRDVYTVLARVIMDGVAQRVHVVLVGLLHLFVGVNAIAQTGKTPGQSNPKYNGGCALSQRL